MFCGARDALSKPLGKTSDRIFDQGLKQFLRHTKLDPQTGAWGKQSLWKHQVFLYHRHYAFLLCFNSKCCSNSCHKEGSSRISGSIWAPGSLILQLFFCHKYFNRWYLHLGLLPNQQILPGPKMWEMLSIDTCKVSRGINLIMGWENEWDPAHLCRGSQVSLMDTEPGHVNTALLSWIPRDFPAILQGTLPGW